jgi:hypothetical protein
MSNKKVEEDFEHRDTEQQIGNNSIYVFTFAKTSAACLRFNYSFIQGDVVEALEITGALKSMTSGFSQVTAKATDVPIKTIEQQENITAPNISSFMPMLLQCQAMMKQLQDSGTLEPIMNY